MRKIIYWILLLFVIWGVVWAVYLNDIKSVFTWDALNTITINTPLEWGDWPYTIESIFKSRPYTVNALVSNWSLNVTVSSILRKGYIWLVVSTWDWTKKPYIFKIIPNATIQDQQKQLYNPDFNINWFVGGVFTGLFTNGETNENNIQTSNLNITNQYISYDGKYYYQIVGDKIIKREKNLEIINQYDIDLWSTWLLTSNVTDIKSINSIIYLRFSNWKITKGGLQSNQSYLFTLEAYSYSDIWVIDNIISSPLSITETEWTLLDFEIIGKYLYTLTTTKIKIYYLTNGNISSRNLIYSKDNNLNIKSFIINDWILLFDNSWKISLINNDFQIYTISEWWSILWSNPWLNFDIFSQLKSSSNIWVSSSVSTKNANDFIVNTPTRYISWKPVYKDAGLIFNIDSSLFTSLNLDKNLVINKFSSSYGSYSGAVKNFSFIIPIVWYWVKLTRNNSLITPELNYDINTIKYNPYKIISWEYYLHFMAYDYYNNTSQEVIKWPIIIDNDTPIIWDLSMLNASQFDVGIQNQWYFSFKSSKKLESISMIIRDNLNRSTSLSTADFSYTKEYDSYKYLFSYNIATGVKSLNFNIVWYDGSWNVGSIVYDYNIMNWWFQVIWMTETNAWINSWNNQQLKNGFLLWIKSTSQAESDVNTQYQFSKQSSDFKQLPFVTIDWVKQLDTVWLKYLFPEFNGKAMKNIDSNFFYSGGVLTSPIKQVQYLNWYFYYHDGNLDLEENNFVGDSMLIVNGNLNINWNILNNSSQETTKYKNNLRIFVVGDITIKPNVTEIDSELNAWWTIITLSNN